MGPCSITEVAALNGGRVKSVRREGARMRGRIGGGKEEGRQTERFEENVSFGFF